MWTRFQANNPRPTLPYIFSWQKRQSHAERRGYLSSKVCRSQLIFLAQRLILNRQRSQPKSAQKATPQARLRCTSSQQRSRSSRLPHRPNPNHPNRLYLNGRRNARHGRSNSSKKDPRMGKTKQLHHQRYRWQPQTQTKTIKRKKQYQFQHLEL